jgi:ribosomal protein L12E/L44/L45/RPP1/RPP2
MPIPQLKDLAKKSGKSLAKIEKDLYPKAQKIAIEMGKKKDDYTYIFGVLKNMLGIEESISYDVLAKGFIKSKYKSLDEYLYNLKEMIISADIPETPEKAPKTKKSSEEEENEEENEEESVKFPKKNKKRKDKK